MELSEKGSTERIRIAWEERVNTALERAGLEVRVDRRTLEAQGLKREAEIHVGQAARQLTERGERPDSTPREVGRIGDGGLKPIVIDYPAIDGGKTRHEANDEIKQRNQSRVPSVEAPELEWTDRAGLVAQERAANDWVRKAQERRASKVSAAEPPGGKAANEKPSRWQQRACRHIARLKLPIRLMVRSIAYAITEPDWTDRRAPSAARTAARLQGGLKAQLLLFGACGNHHALWCKAGRR